MHKNNTTSGKSEDRTCFVLERQKLAGGKLNVVVDPWGQWFPISEPKLKLYIRHNDMYFGWFSIGTGLNGTGSHAIKIAVNSVYAWHHRFIERFLCGVTQLITL